MKIVLIGAGPRGLVAAERLIERQRQAHQFDKLELTLVDPYGVGGRVWPVDQPHELLMNTAIDYITLFTQTSNQITGPFVGGPNLYEWSKGAAVAFLQNSSYRNRDQLMEEIRQVKYMSYASRSLYGAYQQWFYQYLLERVDDTVELRVLRETVQAVKPSNKHPYFVKADSLLLPADAVIMALGHNENEMTGEERRLANFANRERLHYVTPTQPQEYDFLDLQPRQSVILRGLGLSFFDAVALMTTGRGGRFTEEEQGILVYHPSGNEPHIIAGSRRGFPLHAKGVSDRPSGIHDHPHFLTDQWLRNHDIPHSIPGQQFINLLHHDIEYAYFDRLLPNEFPEVDYRHLLAQFIKTGDPKVVKNELPFGKQDGLDWDGLVDPERSWHPGDQRSTLLINYLERDTQMAAAGVATGAVTGALAMYHDLYDQIRFVVDHKLLSDDDYEQFLLRQLNREHTFLSVGPPIQRIAELRALVVAGIVEIVGPEIQVDVDQTSNKFVTWSKRLPEQKYYASYLVEARLPKINAQETTNPLIKQLINDGFAEPHELIMHDGTRVATGAVDVNLQTQHLVAAQRLAQVYFWGVPTEGSHWLMTASPHPGIDDVFLRTADQIAEQIFSEATSRG